MVKNDLKMAKISLKTDQFFKNSIPKIPHKKCGIADPAGLAPTVLATLHPDFYLIVKVPDFV